MGLDRDDLAARNMVAAIRTLDAEVRVPPTLADFAVECADALIARLRPATVAQVADTPEPRRTVGAVVRWNNDSREYVIVSPDGCRAVRNDMGAALFTLRDTDTFVRWATREECERHGLSWVERGAAPPAASPAPAVDREGLAKALYAARWLETNGANFHFESRSDRDGWLRAADAAIAFLSQSKAGTEAGGREANGGVA